MTNYFMVGTIHGGWHGDGAREMLADWIEAGEWVLGWHNMESDPSYQKQAPNNDFRTMLVKAIGVVTEPSTDGHRVGVDWVRDLRSAPVTLPSSYRQTLTKVSDTPASRTLIRDHILPLIS